MSEVISHLKKEPGGSFTAVSYDEDDFFLKVYVISNQADDPEWITVWCEESQLFSDDGYEDYHTPDELPDPELLASPQERREFAAKVAGMFRERT